MIGATMTFLAGLQGLGQLIVCFEALNEDSLTVVVLVSEVHRLLFWIGCLHSDFVIT